MSATGKVGPDHARKPAELQLLHTGSASHDLSQITVATGPGYRVYLAVPKSAPPRAAGRSFTCSMAMPPLTI